MEFMGEGKDETDVEKKSWYQARKARTNNKGREERRRGDRREDGRRGTAQAGRNHSGGEKFGMVGQDGKRKVGGREENKRRE